MALARELGKESAQANATQDRLADLVFELFNSTKTSYISVPAHECVSFKNLNKTGSSSDELCFVAWNEAKVMTANSSSLLFEADRTPASLSQNDNNINHHLMIDQQARSMLPVSELIQRLTGFAGNCHQEAVNSSSPLLPSAPNSHQLARLVYLSAGSLLSLIGILTNLLILLIIFINTKQKCHNILSRGQTSHTNYHYVLLFQLTLTSILLGGYSLLENINSHHHQEDSIAFQHRLLPHDFDNNNINNQQRTRGGPLTCSGNQRVLWDGNPFSSPLSIYLPPTPFGCPSNKLTAEHANKGTTVVGYAILLNQHKHRLKNARQRGHKARQQNFTHARLIQLRCHTGGHDNNSSSEQEPTSVWPGDQTSHVLYNMLATVHLWTIVALAYDRYCAIAHPLVYLRSINETRARTFLVILWAGSLLVNLCLPLGLERLQASSHFGPLQLANKDRNQLAGHLQLNSAKLSRYLGTNTTQGKEYYCSARTMDPPTDILSDSSLIQIIQFLIGLSALGQSSRLADNSALYYYYLPVALSVLVFVFTILAPLVITTICNMSIYSIVKVHERRMSTSSSSQGGGACSYYLGASASTLSQARCMKRDSFLTNNTDLANEARSETCSIASSNLGKLIRASAQVGAIGGLRSLHRDDTLSQCSSNDQEICQLITEQNCVHCFASDQHRPRSQKSISATYSGDCLYKSQLVERLPKPEPSATSIVNRLTKRRRQLASLEGSQQVATDGSSSCGGGNSSSYCNARELILKKKLKRKLSDKEQVASNGGHSRASCSRKSSFAPSEQAQEASVSASIADNCSCSSQQSRLISRQQQQLVPNSESIIRQLKMAGLSFAGIAIGELMASGQVRPLNRSSSCSLGNLASMNQEPRPRPSQVCGPLSQSISRCGQPAGELNLSQNHQHHKEKRLSYVSLMFGANSNQRDVGQERFFTRLLDSDTDWNVHQPRSSSSQQHQQQPQYFNLGGTKSVAFNVVVWLILLMLSVTLPQFALLTLDQIVRANTRSRSLGALLRANLSELLTDDQSEKSFKMESIDPDYERAELLAYLRAISTWLNCICRLLFLLMLPLNGWLYGIRSRSLRTTLKMMLKRYISKKQASIEINQRRKSVVATRSRESSLCCNNHVIKQQQQQPAIDRHSQQSEFPNGRVFRRCASFNLPPQTRQDYYSSNGQATGTPSQDEEAIVERNSNKKAHNNSIRFVLNHEELPAALPPPPPPPPQETDQLSYGPIANLQACGSHLAGASNKLANCLLPLPLLMSMNRFSGSQTSSLDSTSLASSNRSLLSASIQSSQSAAFLLLDQKNVNESHPPNTNDHSVSQSLPTSTRFTNHQRSSRPTRLTSVLKKRNSSTNRRRQDSYDTLRASPSAVLRPILSHPHHVVSFGRTQSLDRDNPCEAIGQSQGQSRHQISNSSGSVVLARARARMTRPSSPPMITHVNSIEMSEGTEHVEEVQTKQGKEEEEELRISQQRSRRPSSDIKFMLTSAGDQAETKLLLHVEDKSEGEERVEAELEQCQQVQDELNFGEREPVEQMLLNPPCLDESHQQQQQQSQDDKLDYYRQIKQAISKYFFSMKRKQQLESDDVSELQARRWRTKLLRQHSDTTNSFERRQNACLFEQHQLLDDHDRQPPCTNNMPNFTFAHGTSRLRKNSLDSHSHKLALKRQLEAYSTLNESRRASTGHYFTGNLATQTSTNPRHEEEASGIRIDGSSGLQADRQQPKQMQQQQQQQQSQQQQKQSAVISHLKPPNFLKLIFDPEAQEALYSSSLALSPIKECSSNHSCASSQTSLSNNAVQ